MHYYFQLPFFLREIAQLSGTLLLMKVLQLYSGDPVKLVVVNSFTVWINLGFLTLHTDGNEVSFLLAQYLAHNQLHVYKEK